MSSLISLEKPLESTLLKNVSFMLKATQPSSSIRFRASRNASGGMSPKPSAATVISVFRFHDRISSRSSSVRPVKSFTKYSSYMPGRSLSVADLASSRISTPTSLETPIFFISSPIMPLPAPKSRTRISEKFSLFISITCLRASVTFLGETHFSRS